MAQVQALARDEAEAVRFRAVGQWTLLVRSLRRDTFAQLGLVIVLVLTLSSLAAPWLAPMGPYEVDSTRRLAPIGTPGHILGTDDLGRDILSRLLYGGQISLRVAFVPVVIAATLGLLLGLVSGFYLGWFDALVMRVLDMFFAFPSILLAIAIGAALGPGLENAILAIVVVSVPVFARLVRASVLAVRHQEFITASRALGAGDLRLLFRQVLPNVVSPLIVYSTLETGRTVLFASGLSFLGLGAQPPAADWGAMLANGRNVLAVAPHVATVPGLVIFLLTLGFNLLGDGLRDALDPRLKT